MELFDKKYPYPVLMPRDMGDDYSVGEFEIDVSAVKIETGVELDFKIHLSCESIKALIDSKKAAVICHIECPQAAYRKAERLVGEEQKILVPSGCLSGKVIASPFVVTSTDVFGYTSTDFNSDYKSLKFDLNCGAVIAVGTQKRFFVEQSQRDLEYKPDIFSVIPYDDTDGTFQVDTTGNKVCIKLPRGIFGSYSALLKSGNNNELLWSSIVLPALVDVLYQVRDKAERDELGALENSVWFRTISSKITRLYSTGQIDAFLKEMDVLAVAQRLLSAPIFVALKKMTELQEELDEN